VDKRGMHAKFSLKTSLEEIILELTYIEG